MEIVAGIVSIVLFVAILAIDSRVNKLVKLNKEIVEHLRAMREHQEH